MTAAPDFDAYDGVGGREAMLRFGGEGARLVLIAPPLFEEANRTRALVVAVLRRLAERGIAGALPDLPGQGESLSDLAGVTLATWRHAFAAAARTIGPPVLVVALRGGALIADAAEARGRLYVAPVTGRALVRDLLRARRVATLAAGEPPPVDEVDAPGPPLLLAGNRIDRALLRDLAASVPADADRVLRPFDGGSGAPRFRPPWLAAEPVVDPALADALADDIAAWVTSCGA